MLRTWLRPAPATLLLLAGCFDSGPSGTGGGTATDGGSGSAGSTGSTSNGTSTTSGTAGSGSASGGSTGGSSAGSTTGGECNPACDSGHYCDPNTDMCLPKKGAGVGCGGSSECDAGLTCLDDVCCTASVCDPCLNCGATGECTITVTSAKDDSGSTCDGDSICDAAGVCLADLGQACGDGAQCASGNCLDDVCCDTDACGACQNCGGDGTCSVSLMGQDDPTGTCNGIDTCDGNGGCVPRWELVGQENVSDAYRIEYTATIGSKFYFAKHSNGGGTQFHKSFDVGTGVFNDEPLANNEYCACGYGGVAVSDGTSIFYAANTPGAVWTPGNVSWGQFPGYSNANVADGESATAYLEGRMWKIGGRTFARRTHYYDIANQTWTIAGLADFPNDDSYYACAGAANGKVYVYGGGSPMAIYTVATNTWVMLPADANDPGGCYARNAPVWNNRLLHAGSGIHQFNLATQQWLPDIIPFPVVPPTEIEQHPFVSGGELYLISYDDSANVAKIYHYLL